MRLAIAMVVLGMGTSSAEVQVATAFPAGTYRGPSYVTRFADGTWTSTSNGSRSGGRYTIDNDLITFTSSPEGCSQERVHYHFVPTRDGFRLKFLDDSCRRGGGDIEYVRIGQ
jgi:hypothetical protein